MQPGRNGLSTRKVDWPLLLCVCVRVSGVQSWAFLVFGSKVQLKKLVRTNLTIKITHFGARLIKIFSPQVKVTL